MARYINLPENYLDEVRQDFNKFLTGGKFADGKLSFSKVLGKVDRTSVVYFNELAYLKMTSLLKEFEKEVAWHTTAYRLQNKETGEDTDNYVITDVMVYPQEVTAASVSMDPEKYAIWLMENDEDERFAHIRAQMHSHVDMPVNPSSVDTNHQEEIIEQLDADDFYIFMIWNKRMNVNIRIYDKKKNIQFETTDVKWAVLDGEYGLSQFVADAKAMVTNKITQYTPPYGGYQGGYNSGYGRSPTYTPETTKPAAGGSTGPYNPVANVGGTSGKGSNDGKGKKNKKKDKKKTKIGAGWAGANACDVDEEEVQTTYIDGCGNVHDMTDPFDACDNPHFHCT